MARKGRGLRTVVPHTLESFMNPSFNRSATAAEGLIEGTCYKKGLLNKQFVYNYNHREI